MKSDSEMEENQSTVAAIMRRKRTLRQMEALLRPPQSLAEATALLNRLNRIEGQVRGIRGMLERKPTVWIFWYRWLQPMRR